MGKQEGLILLGIMDAQGFAQDNRVYSSMGIAPTIRAENHSVQIMDGHNYDKTRQDKTRQDKTRQDKTMLHTIHLLVKYPRKSKLSARLIPAMNHLRAQIVYMTPRGFPQQ